MEQIKKQANEISTNEQTNTSIIQRDLRYILTQKCNYQCGFCHKEWCDGSEKNLLDVGDYDFLFSTARDTLWIQQITLSGGEPMIRKDISQITKQLHWSGAKITMVSNGSLIPQYPEVMEYVDTLNLSLHTTNQDLYTILTWSHTKIKDLIDGIRDIHEHYSHLQIKLNSAIINKQNMPNTDDFAYKIELASKYWWKLKYLELCGVDVPGFVPLETFEHELIKRGFVEDHRTIRQGIYKKDDIEIITGRVFCSQAKQTKDPQWYCKQYNDIYITPDGCISSCPVDIKKFSAYDIIVSRDSLALNELFQQVIDKDTRYACPFSL
jgi:cyclic pyranopterin phosphate synthase